jgi:hypothetical protein
MTGRKIGSLFPIKEPHLFFLAGMPLFNIPEIPLDLRKRSVFSCRGRGVEGFVIGGVGELMLLNQREIPLP